MTNDEFRQNWNETVRRSDLGPYDFERLAEMVVEISAEGSFAEHLKNRSAAVSDHTGILLDPNHLTTEMARAFISDELGFSGWNDLVSWLKTADEQPQPMLFRYAVAALWRGDFTALDRAIGHDRFTATIREWFKRGFFENEAETFAEAFAAACFLDHADAAEFLLDKGVDPYAGMRTGLAGFHYAASSGRVEVAKVLIERRVPTEVENMYGGTVLGQALWSAIHEHTDRHAEVVELLIEGGAYLWPETLEWWNEQEVPSFETKDRIAKAIAAANS